MEEILASIRRIIADDQGLVPPARPLRPSTPMYGSSGSSHNAGHDPASAPLMHAAPAAAGTQPVTIEADALAAAPRAQAPQAFGQPAPHNHAPSQRFAQPQQYSPQPAPEPAPHYAPQPAPAPQPVQQAHGYSAGSFSAPVVASNAPAESALLSAQTDASVANAFEALTRTMMLQNSPFMEETVRDLLRPMLKQWLDDNLPPLVERLVRSEIERVARGGR